MARAVPPVIVTRPAPGNAATHARLADAGIAARLVPLALAEPVAWTVPDARVDALLLTSANAVRFAGPGLAAVAHLPAWCVGPATAAAARTLGLTVAQVGDGGVDALLAGDAPPRMLWLSGENRTIVTPPPGAMILPVPCYRMAALPVDPAALAGPAILLIHSVAAARRLATLVTERSTTAVVAISGAVAAAAGPGWRQVEVPAQPDDAAMVAIAVKLCQKRAWPRQQDGE